MNIGLVVEGHGEVSALPVLIRRIAAETQHFGEIVFPTPFRLSRGKFAKQFEIERAVTLMSNKVGDHGVVMVVLDADDDCPCELAATIRGWIEKRHPELRFAVVVANKEFECWLIASAEQQLRGVRGLSDDATCPSDPDAIRDGKGWLDVQMPTRYSETLDQAAFASQISCEQGKRSRSFRKLLKEVEGILAAA